MRRTLTPILLIGLLTAITSFGQSPDEALIDAVVDGEAETVKILLDKGANPNARDRNGYTVLMYAASKKEHCTIAEMLLAKGADANATGGVDKKSPLTLAIEFGIADTVKCLVTHGAKLETDLLTTVASGGVESVKAFLNKGRDVNRKDKLAGWTPLTIAASLGYTDIVKALLAQKADPHLEATSETHHSEGVPLTVAAGNGHTDIVEVLLNHGANINAKNEAGQSALMVAIINNFPDVAKGLLDKKADVNARTPSGMTALICAATLGRTEMVRILLDRGADVRAKDNRGQTALSLAEKDGYREIVELLRKAGVKK